MNSFRAVHDALVFEQRRQAEVLDSGGTIPQETRGWVDDRAITVSQRSKEHANDYRYFPEPDLPPLRLSRSWVSEIEAAIPEMPAAREARLRALGLTEHEAVTITDSQSRAEYFDRLSEAIGLGSDRSPKLAANWLLGEVSRWLNEHSAEIEDFPLQPGRLAELIRMSEDGKITAAVAKDVFEQMAATGKDASIIVAESGLAQISGGDELTEIARKVIAENQRAVDDYRAGKEAALNSLMGRVMKETRGRANPQTVISILERELTVK
jgi:aspartyl-tRNA(Asn)/glutamyl-tRNA(Gln) amidotransferase subunit B